MTVLNIILNMIKTLSEQDFIKLKSAIISHTIASKTLSEYTEELRLSIGRVCSICGSIHVVRNGHRADDIQHFKCRDCDKSFVINTNSITAGTHKDLDTWQKYNEYKSTYAISSLSRHKGFSHMSEPKPPADPSR